MSTLAVQRTAFYFLLAIPGFRGIANKVFPAVKKMKNSRNKHQIEDYQCGTCGRVFYIDPRERTALDLEFGCPYGCDDAALCSQRSFSIA